MASSLLVWVRFGRPRGLAAALGAALLVAGCVPALAPRAPRLTAEEQQAWAAARAAAARSPAAEAAELEAFLVRYPRSSLSDDALVRLAELELARGRTAAARAHLERAIAEHPRGDRTAAARLLLARIEQERGDTEAAWRALADLRLSLLGDEERREAHRLLAEVAGARGDAAHELYWLSRIAADEQDPEAAARASERIEELLDSLDASALEQAAERLGRRAPAGRVWMEVASRHLRAGRADEARQALERAAKLPLTREEARRHVALEEALADLAEPVHAQTLPPPLSQVREVPSLPIHARGTLGAVLPLGGRLGDVAEESLRGVLLAADAFREGAEPADGVRVRVRDSQGDPARAAEAVEELTRGEGVSAVIGPVLAEAARAASDVAEARGVPLLTLTRHEQVARARPHVFRIGLTPRLEAETLAEHAITKMGLRRFAILYPDDRYGREFRALFWQAVETRGGRVVGIAHYDPKATDFAAAIRPLVGYALLTPGEERRIAERRRLRARAKRLAPEAAAELRRKADAMRAPDGGPLPPVVDFDALFIPDGADKVALIAPQLAFHEVEGVTLLGTSGWHHPDLMRVGRRHVEGAVFTTAFDPDHPHPLVRWFVEHYEREYGAPPSVFAAEAFDATNLALSELARGRGDPEDLRAGLLSVRLFPGVSGTLAMGPDGNAVKRPFVMGVRRGRFVSLE